MAALLRAAGWQVNRKRVDRIWRAEGVSERAVRVTGATGRVGRAIARALAGHARVMVATRRPAGGDGTGGNGPGGATWRRLDIADPSTDTDALVGVDAIFLVRPPAMARPSDFVPFLDAARSAGVARVTRLSARGADRIRILPHHGIERLKRQRFQRAVILRQTDFMQSPETVHREAIARADEIVAPAGDGASAFVDVRDGGGRGPPGRTPLAGPTISRGPRRSTSIRSRRSCPTCRSGGSPYRPPALLRFIAGRMRTGAPLPMALAMRALHTAQRLGAARAVTGDLPRLLVRPATSFADHAARRRDVWNP